jgi:hypothetical protein
VNVVVVVNVFTGTITMFAADAFIAVVVNDPVKTVDCALVLLTGVNVQLETAVGYIGNPTGCP